MFNNQGDGAKQHETAEIDRIESAVGRVVHYYPGGHELADLNATTGEPLAALISAVHDDGLVNLMVIGATGKAKAREAVPLIQADEGVPPGDRYCTWAPDQDGHAARTEQAERKFDPGDI